MRLENSFEVRSPKERAWALLMDVPRVVPCMPGAALRETLGDDRWKATIAVKLGPVNLMFDTDVVREEYDEARGVVVLTARAREQRGRGGATATIHSALTEGGGVSRVAIATDLKLSGAVARYGAGLVEEVSRDLVGAFADSLETELEGSEPSDQIAPEPRVGGAGEPRPIGGLSLVLRATWRAIKRLFGHER